MSENLDNKVKSLDTATTGTGAGIEFGGRIRSLVAILIANGTVTGGTVVLEESSSLTDTNTWAQIAAYAAPATGVTQSIQATGCFLCVRARITSNITGGGSVTVTVAGN